VGFSFAERVLVRLPSKLLRLLVAMVGVVVGLGLLTGAASAEELPPAESACLPEAHVIAPLGEDAALPTARLVTGPEVDAAAVPGGWAPTVVDAGEPTTATWSIPVTSTDPVTVWVVDGDRPAFPLPLTPGCTDAAVDATLAADCVTGAAEVTITSWDQEARTVEVTGAVTGSLPVAPGAEAIASAPALEDSTVSVGVAAGRTGRLHTATVDCVPPPAPPAPPADEVLGAVEDDVYSSPEHPVGDVTAKAVTTVDPGTAGSLTVSAPSGSDGPAPLVAVPQEAPSQVQPTQAQVTPENARVQGQGQQAGSVAVPGATTAPAALAMTGADTTDLLRLGAALVGLGLAVQRLGRPAHFAAKGGSQAA
jgi:hypothetical protein